MLLQDKDAVMDFMTFQWIFGEEENEGETDENAAAEKSDGRTAAHTRHKWNGRENDFTAQRTQSRKRL